MASAHAMMATLAMVVAHVATGVMAARVVPMVVMARVRLLPTGVALRRRGSRHNYIELDA